MMTNKEIVVAALATVLGGVALGAIVLFLYWRFGASKDART